MPPGAVQIVPVAERAGIAAGNVLPLFPVQGRSRRRVGGGHRRARHGTAQARVQALHRPGRENSPSRPTIRGMTAVDRPTINGQFLGGFHVTSVLSQNLDRTLQKAGGKLSDRQKSTPERGQLDEREGSNSAIACAASHRSDCSFGSTFVSDGNRNRKHTPRIPCPLGC
jgi:hypothetical protein